MRVWARAEGRAPRRANKNIEKYAGAEKRQKRRLSIVQLKWKIARNVRATRANFGPKSQHLLVVNTGQLGQHQSTQNTHTHKKTVLRAYDHIHNTPILLYYPPSSIGVLCICLRLRARANN